jgi:DNA repair protein RadD
MSAACSPHAGYPEARRVTPLRDYQAAAVQAVRAAYADGGRAICLVSPTGSGKTRMGVEFAARHLARGGRGVLWLAHRVELVQQAAERLRGEGVERVGVIAAGVDPDPDALVQVASTQTLLARGDIPDVSLLVADECHHYVSEQWGELAKRYRSSVILGLTATPERGDGKPLGDLFDRLVVGASPRLLTDAGHLVPCHIEAPKRYNPKRLSEDPVEAYQRVSPNGLALAFTRTVKGATQMSEAFEAAGIASGVVCGTTQSDVRACLIAKFSAGEIRVLVNVGVLTEGTDIPAADTCILARGIGSAGLYIQIVGRVLRPAPGKTRAVLLDLVGASNKHGPPAADREYSLAGRAITWRKPPRGLRATEPVSAPKTGVSSALLSSVSPERAAAMVASMARLTAQAAERGYKRGWAAYRFQAEFGVLPWHAQ